MSSHFRYSFMKCWLVTIAVRSVMLRIVECIPRSGVLPPTKIGCLKYDTQQYVVARLQFWHSGDCNTPIPYFTYSQVHFYSRVSIFSGSISELDWSIWWTTALLKASSNTSCSITFTFTFTFGLMPLRKIMNQFIPTSYGMNSKYNYSTKRII